MVPAWVRRWATLLLVAAGAGVLALAALGQLPFVAMAESWLVDLRIATGTPPEPQHPDILVVAVTEETVKLFPYRSPIDRAFLADLLTTLEKRGVRAIGVDLLFDQPTEPAKDARLRQTLRDIKVPLVVGYADASAGLTDDQIGYLDDFVPRRLRGFSNLERDPYHGAAVGIVADRPLSDATIARGFAKVIAGKLGKEVPAGSMPLAWRPAPDAATSPFAVYPAQAVAVLPPAWFKNKIVLVGADLSLADRHRSPLDLVAGRVQGSIPGVMVHAHALAQLLDDRAVSTLAPERTAVVTFGVALIGALLALVEAATAIRVALAIGMIAAGWWGTLQLFHLHQLMLPLVTPTLAFGLALVMADMLVRHRERRERRFIKHAFAQYISPALVEQLAADPARLKLGGERREMTFLFTDVSGFTALAEHLDPSDLASLLNTYLDGVCKAILAHGGTVNDFIGDAVFALFGAPMEQADHAARAVACALAIDRFSEDFQARQRAQGVAFGRTRIGLHSGVATIGNMGSEFRFKYSPVGDAVNVASRLEALNKYFGTRLCVSDAVLRQCSGVVARPLAEVAVAGRAEFLAVHELAPDLDGAALAAYAEAYALLQRGDRAAQAAFAGFAAAHPKDSVAAYHLRRLAEGFPDARVTMTEK